MSDVKRSTNALRESATSRARDSTDQDALTSLMDQRKGAADLRIPHSLEPANLIGGKSGRVLSYCLELVAIPITAS